MTKLEEMGQRILLRRRELKLSQKALAAQCQCPYQVISGLERGEQDVYSQRLAIIARHLGISTDYLLGLLEHAHPHI
jgi:transcriptional regulator with XRE-family HTH domain